MTTAMTNVPAVAYRITGEAPSALIRALNVIFNVGLADAAEARAWLRAGGFDQLDGWIATRPADPEEALPEETAK